MQSPATALCAGVAWLYVDCFVVIRSIRVGTIRLSELGELLYRRLIPLIGDATKKTFNSVSALLGDPVPVELFLSSFAAETESWRHAVTISKLVDNAYSDHESANDFSRARASCQCERCC